MYTTDSEDKLASIYIAANKMSMSKTQAAKIVGGIRYLERLVKSGQIRMTQKVNQKGYKWYCNAYDVLRYAN